MFVKQWQGYYFDQNGEVKRALQKLNSDRATHEALQGSLYSRGGHSQSGYWYCVSIVEAMSALLCATDSVWRFWRIPQIVFLLGQLKKLCLEYEKARRIFSSHEHDEIFVACLLRVGSFTRMTAPKEVVWELRAKEVVERILETVRMDEKSVPEVTLLFLKARHSHNPLVPQEKREKLALEVSSRLDRAVRGYRFFLHDEIYRKIQGGYKTVYKLGMLVSNFRACCIAVEYGKLGQVRTGVPTSARYVKYRIIRWLGHVE